jgi:hypothetical protein
MAESDSLFDRTHHPHPWDIAVAIDLTVLQSNPDATKKSMLKFMILLEIITFYQEQLRFPSLKETISVTPMPLI